MNVLVGLSGGVDSSVAAHLLLQAGHRVVGCTMKLWRPGRYPGGDRDACFGPHEDSDIASAAALARLLHIPFHVFDLSDAYQRVVLDYFRTVRLAGQTPNPCVRCNQAIKFGLLPQAAREAGIPFDAFATGHYARIVPPPAPFHATPNSSPSSGRYSLLRAIDLAKDQSYFLYRLSQEQLARTLFPLGGFTKPQVREIARNAGLPAALRPDSQDFYSGDPADLLGDAPGPGPIVTLDGRVIGHHDGFWRFTIGQRRGLNLPSTEPWYVVALRPADNAVVVGRLPDALVREFPVADLNWSSLAPPASTTGPIPVRVKIRSTGAPYGPATFTPAPDLRSGVCSVPDGLSGVAPGQSAVFYAPEDDRLLLGGIIQPSA